MLYVQNACNLILPVSKHKQWMKLFSVKSEILVYDDDGLTHITFSFYCFFPHVTPSCMADLYTNSLSDQTQNRMEFYGPAIKLFSIVYEYEHLYYMHE